MKIQKVLSCFLLALLGVIVCASTVLADAEADESVKMLLAEAEDASDFEEGCGEIFEKDDEIETETPCLSKKAGRKQKFTKGEANILFGVLHTVFFDEFSESNMNSQPSVSVCTEENRKE